MKSIQIGSRTLGADYPPIIVAEMSGNHNQSLERALQIVDEAAQAGVHAVKLQTYTADTMTMDIREGEFLIDDPESLWNGKNLYELYQKASTPWEWHQPIIERCGGHGLICFSTPFDLSAVDFLEKLDTPAYKIASFEITDLPLIRRVAATGRPIIISTGMSTVAEIDDAVRTAKEGGCGEVILLQCTSTYPASPDDSNIATIPHLHDLFDVQVGLSDHTSGIGVAIAGVALGACLIEKHFTLNRADGGVDAAFSLEPDEMAMLVEESERAWRSLGTISYGPTKSERASLKFRRSIYVVKDLSEGEVITNEKIKTIRPGFGLPPKHLDAVLGRKVRRPVRRGTALSWNLLK
jgi:pseudaminic acid synthase